MKFNILTGLMGFLALLFVATHFSFAENLTVDTETINQLSKEVKSMNSGLPSGFSRFLSGIGDAFTFDNSEKVNRAMERVQENKLRILKMMQEKQSGLYNSGKFSEDLEKLQKLVEEDSQKMERALNSIPENANEKAFENIGKIQENMRKQLALDSMISTEAKNTAAKAKDLSSKELETLKKTETNTIQNTNRIRNTISNKEASVAAKMIASGKTSERLNRIAENYNQNKEQERIRTEEGSGMGAGEQIKEQVKSEIENNGNASGMNPETPKPTTDVGGSSETKPSETTEPKGNK